MNYPKYSNIAGFATGPLLSGNQSSTNAIQLSGTRPSSNSRPYIAHTSSTPSSALVGGTGRQEQSVERLKSCIADLKKLATSKVKRGSSHVHGASRRDPEEHSYLQYNKANYESRGM